MKPSTFLLVIASLCFVDACGGGGTPPPPPPPAVPTVAISALSTTINLGDAATLTWSSTNATSCTASSSPSESDWSGQVATSGSQPVTPASLGTSTYSLQCTGKGGDTSNSASVMVNIGALVIVSGTLPNGTVGTPYDRRSVRCSKGSPGCTCLFPNNPQSCFRIVFGFPLSATGGIAPYVWSWTAAPGLVLPAGLSLSGSTISGTPSAAGSYGIVVTVTDSQSPAGHTAVTYTLTINNPTPPSITSTAPRAGSLNLPYTFTFSATGFAPLTWTKSGALPPGLLLGSDGVLAGTPTKLGSYPITATVTDGVGQTSSEDVTIEIFPHGFKTTGSMAEARREGHTATLLTNGKVLVAGGIDATTTAELFDPASGTFSATGSMVSARHDHTATVLFNGRVLVAGGDNVTGATVELFDPVSGSFASTGSMSTARTGHTATLLTNGKVLVTGGIGTGGVSLATAELFDPASGTFTLTGSVATPRTGHTTTLLANGKVLVTGGMDAGGTTVATAELFDPVTGSFTSTGNMGTTRRDHRATLLTNGKVLVTGGVDASSTIVVTAELFDPVSGTFASTGSMRTAHIRHQAVLLQDGTVLVAGGGDSSGLAQAAAELGAASGASFAGTGSLITGRDSHTATLLNDGRVLVTGGIDFSGTPLATAELYQ